ncbi:MAG: hypothetical protein LLG02_00115 [Pelosinus sp.]|nr:hypothetical protein [Pelosinus sp.]
MLEVVIGIAGTAKNTGKTTTTAAILDELRHRGIPILLTSIGYDGENLDNITGLPKPRLKVTSGDIIATAEKCVATTTAKLKILDKTDINTPLGKVLITQVLSPGLIVTAGPNKSTDVRLLRDLMHKNGPGVTIFDGALSRIAPMAETDGIILATGAARNTNIPTLSIETEILWRICSIPYTEERSKLTEKSIDCVTLFDSNFAKIASSRHSSLLTVQETKELFQNFNDSEGHLVIPGITTENALQTLYQLFINSKQRLFLNFGDPIKLLTASNLASFYRQLEDLSTAGIFIGVLRRVPLLAVTVNPFYPEYRFESKTYVPNYIDFRNLEISVKRKIAVPVYNVERHGASKLVDIILAHAYRFEAPGTIYFD